MNCSDFKDKPLFFFEGKTVGDVIQKTGYQCKDEKVLPLCKPETWATEYFYMLAENKDFNKEAIQFLSSALNPRVRIWWGYQSVKETYEEINLTPHSKVDAKKMAEEAANDPAHKELLALKPEDFKYPPKIVDGVNLSDPSSWAPPSINENGNLSMFPKPVCDSPFYAKSTAERFFDARAEGLASMPEDIKEKFLAQEAEQLASAEKRMGMNSGEFVSKLLDAREQVKGPPLESPFDSLQGKFADSRAVLDKSIGKMEKHINEMKAQLPKKTPKPPAGTPVGINALEAAKDWLLVPNEENSRKALQLGRGCKGNNKPAGLIALSAFWSGGNIAPPGKQVVAAPPKLPARSIATALVVASHLQGGTRKPDERIEDYLKIGIESAQGIRTWENQILPEHAEDPWAGREGFGRDYN
jgi:hypothetical protein